MTMFSAVRAFVRATLPHGGKGHAMTDADALAADVLLCR